MYLGNWKANDLIFKFLQSSNDCEALWNTGSFKLIEDQTKEAIITFIQSCDNEKRCDKFDEKSNTCYEDAQQCLSNEGYDNTKLPDVEHEAEIQLYDPTSKFSFDLERDQDKKVCLRRVSFQLIEIHAVIHDDCVHRLSLIFRLIDVWLTAAFLTHVVNTPRKVFPTLHHQIVKYLHISAIMIFSTSGNELRVATTWLIRNAVHNWQTRRRLEKQTMIQLATIVLDILLSLSHDQTHATTKNIMAVKWQVRITFILQIKLR